MGVDDSSSFSPSSSSSAESSFRELDDVFLQSQARIWLGEVLHTKFDEQVNICDLLSDGEFLFEVSKALWNMLLVKYMELNNIKAHMFIPVDTRKSSGRYRPYSNVDSFLKVCKVLGLSGVDLFSPSDVVEKRDTRKVCICIRSLSKKARAKRLNVPDFDIVTKTVAMRMPKDVVRCIRRSLELSTRNQSKDTRQKLRQKSSVAAQQQKKESFVEESDRAKKSLSETLSRSSYKDTWYTDAWYLDSGEPETCNNYALTEGPQQSPETDRYEQGPGSAESLLLQHFRNDSRLDSISSHVNGSQLTKFDGFTPTNHEAKSWHDDGEMDQIDFDHLSLQNFAADNRAEVNRGFRQIFLSDMISFRILTNGPPHISEGCSCHLCVGIESHDSNTSPNTSMSRVWRKLPYDVETSPTSSMNSVVGRVLDFDFDFDTQSDPDDPGTLMPLTLTKTLDKVSLMNDESRGMERHVTPSDISAPGSEESRFETNCGDFDLSAESFSLCWADSNSYSSVDQDFEAQDDQISSSQKDSGDSLLSVTNYVTDITNNAQETVLNGGSDDLRKGVQMVDLKSELALQPDCSSHIVSKDSEDHRLAVESSERCHCLIDVSRKGFENVEKEGDRLCSNQNDDVCCHAENRNKAGIKGERKDDDIDKGHIVLPLLKTVAKGTALVGLVFLLHLRKRGNMDVKGDASSRVHVKSTGVTFSTRKGSKIYPVEKFKFGD